MADPLYVSDLVSDKMVSFDGDYLLELTDILTRLDRATTHQAMFMLLATAAWDINVLRIILSFLDTLVREGPEATQNNIKATAVTMGIPVPT